ncbi:MAG: VOC family protein [Leptolyngbyaceae cyanobacterium MO_188.B28]|nr:VOC family protein [Leptolyngbyaceae cyanobacterium MO_188.B28]
MQLNAISPMLEVNDLHETIDYYTNTLGFELHGTWPDDGPAQWAALSAGQVTLMFIARDKAEGKLPTLTGQLYCYPPDVDRLWHELKDKVAIAWPIDNMSYGMREFAIRDCNGYVLTFGQGIEDIST